MSIKPNRPTRPSEERAAQEAAKLLKDEEHRLFIRMSHESYDALKVAAFNKRIPIKALILTLAKDAGIPINPADIRSRGDE